MGGVKRRLMKKKIEQNEKTAHKLLVCFFVSSTKLNSLSNWNLYLYFLLAEIYNFNLKNIGCSMILFRIKGVFNEL